MNPYEANLIIDYLNEETMMLYLGKTPNWDCCSALLKPKPQPVATPTPTPSAYMQELADEAMELASEEGIPMGLAIYKVAEFYDVYPYEISDAMNQRKKAKKVPYKTEKMPSPNKLPGWFKDLDKVGPLKAKPKPKRPLKPRPEPDIFGN